MRGREGGKEGEQWPVGWGRRGPGSGHTKGHVSLVGSKGWAGRHAWDGDLVPEMALLCFLFNYNVPAPTRTAFVKQLRGGREGGRERGWAGPWLKGHNNTAGRARHPHKEGGVGDGSGGSWWSGGRGAAFDTTDTFPLHFFVALLILTPAAM